MRDDEPLYQGEGRGRLTNFVVLRAPCATPVSRGEMGGLERTHLVHAGPAVQVTAGADDRFVWHFEAVLAQCQVVDP